MTSRLLAMTILLPALLLHGAPARAEPGALLQLDGTDGCISNDGTAGACAQGRGLAGALDLAISADGASVYVASFSSDAVAVLARNESRKEGPIGKLAQPPGDAGCVSETGAGPCTDGRGLVDAFAVGGMTKSCGSRA